MVKVCMWGDQNENQSTKLRLRHHPHVSGGKGHQKMHLFKDALQGEIFEHTCFLFTCGWMKMEFFKYDDVINHTTSITHAL